MLQLFFYLLLFTNDNLSSISKHLFNTFFNKNAHEKFEVDYWGYLEKILDETLSTNKNNEIIKIAVASFLPLERSIKLINKEDREKIKIIG